MRIASVILAAGSGTRMGIETPKQFTKIGDSTMLEMSTEAFENNASVDDIFVVVNSEYIERAQDLLCRFKKVRKIVAGGATRRESSEIGFGEVRNFDSAKSSAEVAGDSIVLIHDAARPFVSQEVINRVIEKVKDKGAAVPGVAVKDTIKRVADDIFVETLKREELYSVQTPQGFLYDILNNAFSECAESATDDAALVEKTGVKVYLVLGDERNRKVTTKEDLADDFLVYDYKIGTGFDTHKLVVGRDLILGGIKIQHEKGLQGHSDADVLTHAIMDAILGGLALGDIGKHFPDSDPKYEGSGSMELLLEVCTLMGNYEIVNLDTTLLAEKPKLAPHIEDIKNNIARVLNLSPELVSVKATTTEGLGYVGREEGISAQAIVLMKKKKS